METKVLKCLSRSDACGDVLNLNETSQGSSAGFQFSKAFTYTACLGDTKTATVYLAKNQDGEFAIKVCGMTGS
jgi:hypothetical protein